MQELGVDIGGHRCPALVACIPAFTQRPPAQYSMPNLSRPSPLTLYFVTIFEPARGSGPDVGVVGAKAVFLRPPKMSTGANRVLPRHKRVFDNVKQDVKLHAAIPQGFSKCRQIGQSP